MNYYEAGGLDIVAIIMGVLQRHLYWFTITICSFTSFSVRVPCRHVLAFLVRSIQMQHIRTRGMFVLKIMHRAP